MRLRVSSQLCSLGHRGESVERACGSCTRPPGGSSIGVPQTARGACSWAGHSSPRLWELLGRSDLAPKIARTPPLPPGAPSRTAPSGPQPNHSVRRKDSPLLRNGERKGGGGNGGPRERAWVSRPWDEEEELTCLRWARFSQAESVSRPGDPGETGSGLEPSLPGCPWLLPPGQRCSGD